MDYSIGNHSEGFTYFEAPDVAVAWKKGCNLFNVQEGLQYQRNFVYLRRHEPLDIKIIGGDYPMSPRLGENCEIIAHGDSRAAWEE